ncbi:C-C chemokine receptor type 6-like [Chanos chanos]|uniref:C-C chemokine receptor type 6-like n=1 Tax=Chanos chanos TaxID=29144 RepID=A0A6J2V181_CHACN|nr:C-C chemokine receptor type 6-like [Chanos chanos]
MNNPSYGDIDIEEPCEMGRDKWLKHALSIYIHPIICVVGFIGNVLVIITYAFYKRAKSMTDVYLLNLAVADIIFVLALPLIIYNEHNNWAMGDGACKLLSGLYSMNVYSGILLLACIGTDRYMAIVQASRSFRMRSKTQVYGRVICIIVWFLALMLSLPTFIYYKRYDANERQSKSFDDDYDNYMGYVKIFENHTYDDYMGDVKSFEDDTYDKYTGDEPYIVCSFRFDDNTTARVVKRLVPSSQVAIGFCLPLLIMGFCYTSVILTLQRAKNFQRHKAVRVVLCVVIVFLACHVPYNTTLLYFTVLLFQQMECDQEVSIQVALVVTQTIAYLHCCLNPILYAFVGVNFRNHFRKILTDTFCKGKRYIQGETSYFSRRSVDGSTKDNATSFTM